MGMDIARRPATTAPVAPAPAPTSMALVRPIAQADEALAAWKEFEGLKKKLLSQLDYADAGGKPYVKKSGWRKLATAFGISTEVVREARRRLDDGTIVVDVVMRAIAPNGRYSEAVGSCAEGERKFAHLEHDIRATAQTRAANRAISDLIGGGEVSYEEMAGEEPARQTPPPAKRQTAARTADTPVAIDPNGPPLDTQLSAIRSLIKQHGLVEANVCDGANVATLDKLTRQAAADLLRELQRRPSTPATQAEPAAF